MDSPHKKHLVTNIAYVVVGVWAIVTVASMFTHEYQVLGAVTPVMLIVSGFLFGYRGGKGDG